MKPIRAETFASYDAAVNSIKKYRPKYWSDLSTATRHTYYSSASKLWIVVEKKSALFEVSYYNGCPCNK